MIHFENEPVINVGIKLDNNILFTLKGSFFFNKNIIPEGDYQATISKDKIITSFCDPTSKIELIPCKETSTFLVRNVKIGIGFHWEQLETQEFEGSISLIIEDQMLRLINNVALEKYLKSVISSEMSAMNDSNLLNAHAIISRSWILAQIINKTKKSRIKSKKDYSDHEKNLVEITRWYDREDHENFDVCADDHCQRYQGLTKIISKNAERAINETKGIILTYGNEVCDARFSKCCGGRTEDFENVWEPIRIPYMISVFDSKNNNQGINEEECFCNTSDPEVLNQILIDFDRSTTNFFRWEENYKQEVLSDLLKRKSGFDFGQILDIKPLEIGKSGRIKRLEISGTKIKVIVGKELEIRKWLSESHLFSSAFTITKKYDSDKSIPSAFIIKGRGWGHGVGLCQIGAAMMSKLGYNYQEILKHYYVGTSIKKIY